MGMKPPEGRVQSFSGPELLKRGASLIEPCSHLYISPPLQRMFS